MTADQPLFDPSATGVFADRFAGPDITPARPTVFALQGVPFVELTLQGIYGTLTIGPSTVPIRLSPPVDGMATIDVGPGHLTLDSLSWAARSEPASAAAADPLAALPASLAAAVGGAVISHVRVRVDLTARRLTDVGFDVIGHRPWTLLPDRLAVTDLNLSVNVHRHGGDGVEVSGALTGTLILGGTDVPVVAAPVVRGTAMISGSAGSLGAPGADPGAAADPVADPDRGSVRPGAGTWPVPPGTGTWPVRPGAGTWPVPPGTGTWSVRPGLGTWSVQMDSVDGVRLSAIRDLAGLLSDDQIDSLVPVTPIALQGATGPAAPPGAGDPTESTPPVLTDMGIDLLPSGIVDAVSMTLDVSSVSTPRSERGGTARRSVTVEAGHQAQRVRPVVSITVEGDTHPGPPVS